jgi:branched-chain amino acid transport system substrate-binding protein
MNDRAGNKIVETPCIRQLAGRIAHALAVAWMFIALTIQAEEKIRIGVSVPRTGAAAAYGADIKDALVFANRHFANSAYQLIIEDDQCIDKEAVAIAQKFAHVDKVKYALGFGCSGTVLASAPIYEAAKIVVIAAGTGAPAITNAGDYIFRTKPSLNIAADILVKEFSSKFQKIGVISEETAFCQGLTNAIAERSHEHRLSVVNENYLPGTDDFRSIFMKLKSQGAQALFLNTQGEPGMVVLYRQFRALNWTIPVYGTFTPGSPAFISAFGKDADGIVYADLQFNAEMLNEEGQRTFAEFEKEYGSVRSAEHYAALALIAFRSMDEAIRSGKDVKQYLYDHVFTNLVDGYSFDKNGDVVSEQLTYVLKTLKDGKPALFENK